MEKSTARHIDDEQPSTVEEHYELLVNDNTYIDSKFKKVTPDDLPEWFDEDLFTKARQYYESHLLAFRTAYFTGLILVFLIPTISKILVFTNQSSTPCTAFRRYLQTALHLLHMHIEDVKDSDSKFYRSINTIRWKHANATAAAVKKNFNHGITNRDLALTQFAFIIYLLLEPHQIALTDKPVERKAINHYWRVIGHMLGIPERLNVCRKNDRETTQLCEQLKKKLYLKYLEEPCKEFSILLDAIVGAWECLDPLSDRDTILDIFYKLNRISYNKTLSLYSSINVALRMGTFKLITIPYIGFIVRHFTNILIKVSLWLLERYPVMAWYKYGKENSRISVYPITNWSEA